MTALHTAATPTLLCAKNLSYTPEGRKEPLFSEINVSVGRGDVLCIAGKNGCGKSTLLALAAGLLQGAQGELHVLGAAYAGGHDAPEARTPQRMREAAQGTALLLQDADMQIIGATVAEDLLLSATLAQEIAGAAHKKKEGAGNAPTAPLALEETPDSTAFALATRFGLAPLWHAAPGTLSYGQKRKLCLAAALLRSPRLLLLDEPLSGLDYPAILELRQLLAVCVADGMALVVSTHDLEPFLAIMTQTLLFLPGGRGICGAPQEMLPLVAQAGVRPLGAHAWPHFHSQ